MLLTNMREVLYQFFDAKNIDTFDKLTDAVIMEQFLSSLPDSVRQFVCAKQPCNVEQCADYADLSYEVSKMGREPSSGLGQRTPGPTVGGMPNVAGQGNLSQSNHTFRSPTEPSWRNNANPPSGQYRPNNGNGTPRARYPATNNRGPNAGQFTYPRRPALCSNKLRNAQCEMMCENNFEDAMFYGYDDDVSDDCQDSEAYQSAMDDESNVDVNVADNEFIIRVNVSGVITEAIRDTDNLGPFHVCKELVPDSTVRYNKCVYLTGAFDGCKKRKFPTAKIRIKSESFGVD